MLPFPSFPTDRTPHVVRCADLVESLAREARVHVEIGKPLAEHRLYVEREGLAPLALLGSVAKAVQGSLLKTPDGYEIRRTVEDRKRLATVRIAERTRLIERSLQANAQFRRASGAGGSSEALIGAFTRDAQFWNDRLLGKPTPRPSFGPSTLLPAASLLEGLVRRIRVSNLAAIPTGETRVYEDAPVASASPLPPHDDLLQAYAQAAEDLAEHDLAKALQTRLGPGRLDPTFVRLPDTSQPVARLRLACDTGPGGSGFRLEIYDREGHRLDEANLLAASTNGERASSSLLVRQLGDRPDASWATLSPGAQAAIDAFRGTRDRTPAWFLDPVGREPLDGFVREALAGLYAGEGTRAVVADVPDALWGEVVDCRVKDRVSLDAVRSLIETYTPAERLVEGGVVVWRLADPEFDEARRADRKVLRRYAQDVVKRGKPELRDEARLLHDASPEISPLAERWSIQGAVLGGPAKDIGRLSERSYVLLGAIPDDLWDRFASGEPFTAAGLGIVPDLRRFFGAPSAEVQGEEPVPDLFQHPLELYREGDFGATPIVLHLIREPIMRDWQAFTPEDDRWRPQQPIDRLVSGPSIHFHPEEAGLVTSMTRDAWEERFDPYYLRLGTRTTSRLTIGLPHRLHIAQEMPGAKYDWQPRFVYRNLPEDVRRANWEKAYAEALGKAKERLKNELGAP